MLKLPLACIVALLLNAPALATTPRTGLTHAAFVARDRTVALNEIAAAEAAAAHMLLVAPGDREAQKARAMAIGYRAKLTNSRSDALVARKLFDALVASDPRDAEALAAVGSWHIGAVSSLGGFMASTVLGANRKAGLAAIDRSVMLGGNRAFFRGLAALLRAELNPADPMIPALVQAAIASPTPTPIDIFVQRAAVALQGPLKSGDRKSIIAVAKLWLPLGRVMR
jgi:hypothetical protein